MPSGPGQVGIAGQHALLQVSLLFALFEKRLSGLKGNCGRTRKSREERRASRAN